MDGSQVTGAASSYARKYALNGLLCIDDTKDSDSTNMHGKEKENKATESKQAENGASPVELSEQKSKKVREIMQLMATAGVAPQQVLKVYPAYKQITEFSEQDLDKLELQLKKQIKSKEGK